MSRASAFAGWYNENGVRQYANMHWTARLERWYWRTFWMHLP